VPRDFPAAHGNMAGVGSAVPSQGAAVSHNRETAMRVTPILPALVAACCAGLASPDRAAAASRALRPGEVLGVPEALVLAGDDGRGVAEGRVVWGKEGLEINGSREGDCRLDGNGQQIRTAADWKGRLTARYCEFRGLGSATTPALDVAASGDGDRIVIENSEF